MAEFRKHSQEQTLHLGCMPWGGNYHPENGLAIFWTTLNSD
jgi:hypothetical protein